jgi:hypothetical protein
MEELLPNNKSAEKEQVYLILPDPFQLEIRVEDFYNEDPIKKQQLIEREKSLKPPNSTNQNVLLVNESDDAEHILIWKEQFNNKSQSGGLNTPPSVISTNGNRQNTPVMSTNGNRQNTPVMSTNGNRQNTPVMSTNGNQQNTPVMSTNGNRQNTPHIAQNTTEEELITPIDKILPDLENLIYINNESPNYKINYENIDIGTQTGGSPEDYDYKNWIKVSGKDNKLISIHNVIGELNNAKLNFFKLGTFGLDKRKHIKKHLLFNVDKEYESDFKKQHVPWIYIIAIKGIITKIGETCAGLNKRIESYYSGRNIIERGGTGTSSTTNKYVYNTILYTLVEAEKQGTPTDIVELYGYRIKTRECYVNMLQNSYSIKLAYTKGIEAIIINWFKRKYDTTLLLGMNKSPCVSYNDSISTLENNLFFTPKIMLNTIGSGRIEEPYMGTKKFSDIQITPFTSKIKKAKKKEPIPLRYNSEATTTPIAMNESVNRQNKRSGKRKKTKKTNIENGNAGNETIPKKVKKTKKKKKIREQKLMATQEE